MVHLVELFWESVSTVKPEISGDFSKLNELGR